MKGLVQVCRLLSAKHEIAFFDLLIYQTSFLLDRRTLDNRRSSIIAQYILRRHLNLIPNIRSRSPVTGRSILAAESYDIQLHLVFCAICKEHSSMKSSVLGSYSLISELTGFTPFALGTGRRAHLHPQCLSLYLENSRMTLMKARQNPSLGY